MNTAGRTVPAFSAITIALVLVGLLFFPLEAVRSGWAPGCMVTALLSAPGRALTVLPALKSPEARAAGRGC
ncbi:hypothetical protein ACRAWF_06720 [Streptomyces sp. L7]